MVTIDDLLGKEIETLICSEGNKGMYLVTKISIMNPNAFYRIRSVGESIVEYESLYQAMEHYKEL